MVSALVQQCVVSWLFGCMPFVVYCFVFLSCHVQQVSCCFLTFLVYEWTPYFDDLLWLHGFSGAGPVCRSWFSLHFSLNPDNFSSPVYDSFILCWTTIHVRYKSAGGTICHVCNVHILTNLKAIWRDSFPDLFVFVCFSCLFTV